jgi:DNA-binding GntR family transcriptional regulator
MIGSSGRRIVRGGRKKMAEGFVSMFAGEDAQATPRTLSGRAYSHLHDAIVRGQLAPGERLRIEDLALSLKLSPTPIREALYRLELVGLANHEPHRGARVTELSSADLQELYEARLALETLAIRKAAEMFTREIGDQAREHLRRYVAAQRQDSYDESAHKDFHFTLYSASGSKWLVRLITPLWESCERYRHKWVPLKEELRNRGDEHNAILDACASRDPNGAALLLHNHLAMTANFIASQMTGQAIFPLMDRSAQGGF